MKKIAITGGVASGKTTVCRAFQKLGAFVVNADAIVHELLSPNTTLAQQVIALFGQEIFQNGTLNRRAIADVVFTNPEMLHGLEKLLHPAVLHKIEELYKKALREGSHSLFVVEIPLLYEIGQEGFYDAVVCVVANDELARERFKKEGFPDETWAKRMNRQLPVKEKARRADYVIQNNGTLEDLFQQVDLLNKRLSSHES